MLFTSSWDDGHPADLRLADLLVEHGFQATFYVPHRNREGLPVLKATELRYLSTLAEIGSHTHDHVYADSVPLDVWREQVSSGKTALEDCLGHAVNGFCYPGGKLVPGVVELVTAAGFRYARTTENFRLDAGVDRFEMPTTLQFFPHRRDVLARNFLRAGHYRCRLAAFTTVQRHGSLHTRLLKLLELAVGREQAVLHLWGHSWEIEERQLWGELDAFLRIAAEVVPVKDRVTNHQLLERLVLT